MAAFKAGDQSTAREALTQGAQSPASFPGRAEAERSPLGAEVASGVGEKELIDAWT